MSNIGNLLYGEGTVGAIGSTIVADSGTAQGFRGTLNALGGSNINTEGTFINNVIVNLDPAITITNATFGNINIATNRISSINSNGNIILSPDGAGKIQYEDAAGSINSALYFNSALELKSAALLDGQLLVGSTGSDPVAANLIAGSNIVISNNPGSITLSSSGGGIGGALNWNRINATEYSQVSDTALEMQRNNGYIILWNTSPGAPILNLRWPSSATLTIGDIFSIAVIQGYGIPSSSSATVYINPSVNNYGVQATYQSGPIEITTNIRPIVSNGGGMPSITFVYTGNTSNISGSSRPIMQVIQTMGDWRWNVV